MHILQTRQGVEALQDLGVRVPEDFNQIQQAPIAQARKMLADLKDRVKHAFKKLAVELHPDKTGNDPVKTEKFKLLVQVREAFDQIDIQPRPLPAPMPVMYWRAPVVTMGGFQSTVGPTVTSTHTTYYVSPFDTGTATGSVTGPTVAWRVAKMRPF